MAVIAPIRWVRYYHLGLLDNQIQIQTPSQMGSRSSNRLCSNLRYDHHWNWSIRYGKDGKSLLPFPFSCSSSFRQFQSACLPLHSMSSLDLFGSVLPLFSVFLLSSYTQSLSTNVQGWDVSFVHFAPFGVHENESGRSWNEIWTTRGLMEWLLTSVSSLRIVP